MLRLFTIILLGWLPATAVHADSGVRCDANLVQRGFTFYEVEERCGEPAFALSRTDFRYPGYLVQVDEWVYELGRNRFRRQLTFENGRLRDIETRRKPRRLIAEPARLSRSDRW